MKAILMRRPGSRDVLEVGDVPTPVPGPHDLRVALRAAALNPADYKIRRSGGGVAADRFPIVLGADGSGTVAAVGAAVTRFAVGDEVYFCNGGFAGIPGTYATETLVDERFAARKPVSISHIEAAAVPLVLITAWESLYDRIALVRGDRVLIHAGAGGVGHIAIQLAREAGAHVATTVSGAEKAALARSLGAEHTIDYRSEDFVTATRAWTQGLGADVVFDTVGGETFAKSFGAVRFGGRFVTCVESEWPADGSDTAQEQNLTVGFEWMPGPMVFRHHDARIRQREILEAGAALIDGGKLAPVIYRTFPLAEIRAAHALLEEGRATGKIVLEIA
ncbi:MAG: zinc-dependent alcohol dehydrogenase family protein [Vulcanimicrobiaceae bacterium]